MTAKFDHEFSGMSVWIEPDPEESSHLFSEMEHLRTRCGGSEAGLYPFVPHCTLLYNTSLPDSDVDGCHQTRQQQGESLLRQCLEEYRKQVMQKFDDNQDEAQETKNNDINQLQLIPTSHYYFPYPKTADNGKGFGCCISLLILETTPRLKLLHDIVRNIFPPDERHGDDASSSSNDTNGGEADGDGPPRFRPHMALVYAPEKQQNVINGWLEKYTLQNEEEKLYEKWASARHNDQSMSNNDREQHVACWKAKYLSLWSTEGTLDEWYPICILDLDLEI